MVAIPPAANEKGFTLVEALVATMVLAIGIVSLMVMQGRAVSANASAFSRTSAGGVAIAVLETMKALPFDDPNLTATHATIALMPDPTRNDWNNLVWNDPNVRLLTAASLAAMPMPMLANEFQMAGANLTDRVVVVGAASSAGSHTYQLGWAVVNNAVVGVAATPSKTIRVYLTWPGAMGAGTSVITTVKYNNITL